MASHIFQSKALRSFGCVRCHPKLKVRDVRAVNSLSTKKNVAHGKWCCQFQHGFSMVSAWFQHGFVAFFTRYNLEDLLALPAPAATTEVEVRDTSHKMHSQLRLSRGAKQVMKMCE